jgi:hypothetical protein
MAVLLQQADYQTTRKYWNKLKGRQSVGYKLSPTENGSCGRIAKKARLSLESKTGKSVITSENYLPPAKNQKQIKQKPDNPQKAKP